MRRKAAAALCVVAALPCWAGSAGVAEAGQAGRADVLPTPVATASAAVLEDERTQEELKQAFYMFVAPHFDVSDGDGLDEELFATAKSLQAEHLPRVRALMHRWMLEELHQLVPSGALPRVLVRLANEFALWGRDTTGSLQDALLALALKMPAMCRPVAARTSELVERLARLQGLPPDRRQAAMAAERELLARWGQPRQVSEVEPVPAEEELLKVRANWWNLKKPMPQVLFVYLNDKQLNGEPLDLELADSPMRCVMHQWAGADPAQFRAAMAMQVADMFQVNRREAAEPKDYSGTYPSMPYFLGIQGVVTVQADVDNAGHFVRGRVLKRAVEVPGIRGVRPFAHERVLELASLARAREMVWLPATTEPGERKAERQFEWNLK